MRGPSFPLLMGAGLVGLCLVVADLRAEWISGKPDRIYTIEPEVIPVNEDNQPRTKSEAQTLKPACRLFAWPDWLSKSGKPATIPGEVTILPVFEDEPVDCALDPIFFQPELPELPEGAIPLATTSNPPQGPQQVPEPGSLILFGLGAAGMTWYRLRKRQV